MTHVLVIGGGIAGLEASRKLTTFGIEVSIIERSNLLGGKLNQWDTLFPDNRPALELLHLLQKDLSPTIHYKMNTTVQDMHKFGNLFEVTLTTGDKLKANAILVTTGFEVFDAQKKEEYGYSIYDNVITSADLEKRFRENSTILTANGKIPSRVSMIHCVGSRDEKAGNSYCSQVCCITAIKQAIKIKKKCPETEVFCFYMDLRLWGKKHETIYKEAQMTYGIQFIRGRLSECFENQDGSVQLKAEDTLLGKPITMKTDLVVLMTGMVPSLDSLPLRTCLQLNVDENQFIKCQDDQIGTSFTNVPGIFVAGACSGPKTISNTILEASDAVLKITEYLNQQSN